MRLIALALLCALAFPACALTDEAALELFNRARAGNAAAFDELRRAAEAGDAPAQFQLGRAYSHGASVQRDDVTAARWVEKAAEQGHLEAQSNIGYLYSAGQGVPRDTAKTMSWWTRAAEAGFAQAQFNLAIAYLQGKLTGKDEAKAFAWMSKAAAQGNSIAAFNLASMLERGDGVPRDAAEALQWARRAAARGNAGALSLEARLCRDNPGLCERSPARAHFVYELGEPRLRIVIPDAPPMQMGPHPLAATTPHARAMGGGPEGYSISVLTPTSDTGMSPVECANSLASALVRRYALEPHVIGRRRNGDSTFVLLFPVKAGELLQLKAYLLSGHGGTHCIEVHLSKTARSESEIEPWFAGFSGARIEAY